MSQKVFDFIIVGAGSAGAVIANRLSKNMKSTVALIEAGPTDDSHLIKSPVGFGFVISGLLGS